MNSKFFELHKFINYCIKFQITKKNRVKIYKILKLENWKI